METSQSIAAFSKAFVAAQLEMGAATKGSANPFFKSKYADLNAVREACVPALNKHGISVLQPIVQIEGKNYVRTLLLHETGEFMSCNIEIIYAKPNDAQAQGSGISYARRYGLQSMVNIGAEDDDGNKASNPGITANGHTNGSAPKSKLPELKPGTPAYAKALDHITKGGTWEQVEKTYYVSVEVKKGIETEAKTTA